MKHRSHSGVCCQHSRSWWGRGFIFIWPRAFKPIAAVRRPLDRSSGYGRLSPQAVAKWDHNLLERGRDAKGGAAHHVYAGRSWGYKSWSPEVLTHSCRHEAFGSPVEPRRSSSRTSVTLSEEWWKQGLQTGNRPLHVWFETPPGFASRDCRSSAGLGMRAARHSLLRTSWLQLLLACLTLGVRGNDAMYEEDGTWSTDRQRWGPSEVKRQGLIPFPRVGRSPARDAYLGVDDRLGLDTDVSPDWAFLVLPYKRRSNNFTPRIGRKRRSVGVPEDSGRKDQDARALSRHLWPELDWPYSRVSHQLIPVPRSGRGAFVPRLGKRRMGYEEADMWDDGDMAFLDDPKRGSFTPRIGRGAFTPRIGRTPFTPRVGRGTDKTADGKEAEASSSNSGATGV